MGALFQRAFSAFVSTSRLQALNDSKFRRSVPSFRIHDTCPRMPCHKGHEVRIPHYCERASNSPSTPFFS